MVTGVRWRPKEGRGIYNIDALKVGDIIAIDSPGYRNKPWRVHEIRGWRDDWLRVILRPDGALYDFAQHNVSVGIRKNAIGISILPEHYGTCHKCGEIMPCAEVWTTDVSTALAEDAARFEVEGVCPTCQEPVTRKQGAYRFEENLHVPLGPPVVYHARQRCRGGAISYDKAIAVAHGTEPRLSCTGLLTRHMFGHEECTNITCPGVHVAHGNFAMCYVLKCNRPECGEFMNERR